MHARWILTAALSLAGLTAGGCSIDLAELLNGGDDWLDSSDSCNDHARHHAAAPAAPADPIVAFPPNTR
jgi:hypothetical protein